MSIFLLFCGLLGFRVYDIYAYICMKCCVLPSVYSYTKTLFVVNIYNFGGHEGMCVPYI